MQYNINDSLFTRADLPPKILEVRKVPIIVALFILFFHLLAFIYSSKRSERDYIQIVEIWNAKSARRKWLKEPR